jgi:hypothetical protein
MKRAAVLLAVLFLTAGVAFAAERGSVPTSEIPEVIEKIGNGGDQKLEASLFPYITVTNVIGDMDDACAPPNSSALKALGGKSILTTSSATGERVTRTAGTDTTESTDLDTSLISWPPPVYKPLPIKDLITTVNILPAHQETAKILVFWTVRVVGTCPTWHIDGHLCGVFEGEADFLCKAENNDVKTYVSIRDAEHNKSAVIKTDNPCTLQIPQMVSGSADEYGYDPTITGTYVITKNDFPLNGNKIPLKVEIQIYWQNMGALRITSPDKMRNMIINVIPYSRAKK